MPILIRCPVLYTTTHTPRRRLALLLHLEPLFLPLPPSRASASCCELAPLLCSPAACEPSSKALRRGPYLCSRLVRTRGGGTVGGWTGAPVPWCLCLGQHGRDAAIERHLPGVRSVRYAHARRHGCHRQRPPRKGRRRDTRRPSSDVCRAASFWVFFLTEQSRSERQGDKLEREKTGRSCAYDSPVPARPLATRKAWAFVHSHGVTGRRRAPAGRGGSRRSAAAARQRRLVRVRVRLRRHAPCPRFCGTRRRMDILVAGDADLSGPLRQR